MNTAEKITIIFAGIFFLIGLLTGVWKYQQMMQTKNARAHPYVDISHRASLLYSFAALLILQFLKISQLPNWLELISSLSILLFFASAILFYLLHGLLKDTTNQFKPPFNIGMFSIPVTLFKTYMILLVIVEILGFIIIFYGAVVEILK
ncbi:hypothetical protein [Sessilibacter sp. MAH2]